LFIWCDFSISFPHKDSKEKSGLPPDFFPNGSSGSLSPTFLQAKRPVASFIAWLLGITVVNPLKPHYRCPSCKSAHFHNDVQDGWDLPERTCSCGSRMLRDGHSIPCEGAMTRLTDGQIFEIRLPKAHPVSLPQG